MQFLARQIDRALSRDDGGDLVVRKAAQFADRHMGVDLIGRMELRAGRRGWRFRARAWAISDCRHGLDQIPDGTAELREADPGIPWADQLAILVDGGEALETGLDALFHVVVEVFWSASSWSFFSRGKRMLGPILYRKYRGLTFSDGKMVSGAGLPLTWWMASMRLSRFRRPGACGASRMSFNWSRLVAPMILAVTKGREVTKASARCTGCEGKFPAPDRGNPRSPRRRRASGSAGRG